MLIVYNEYLDLIGLWEPGWNVVLVSRLVYAHAPGNRKHSSLVSDLHSHTSNWAVIGSL